MTAERPGVCTSIVTKQRLSPIMRFTDPAPQRRVRLRTRLRIGSQDASDIPWTRRLCVASAALVMPEKVKHSHESIRHRRANLSFDWQFAPQCIRCRPRRAPVIQSLRGLGPDRRDRDTPGTQHNQRTTDSSKAGGASRQVRWRDGRGGLGANLLYTEHSRNPSVGPRREECSPTRVALAQDCSPMCIQSAQRQAGCRLAKQME